MFYYNGLFDNLLKGIITGVPETGEKEDSEKLIFGTMDPDSGQSGVDTSIERISREIDARTARKKALAYQATESRKPVEKEIPSPEPARQATTSVDKPYQIIAGSFLVPNNAERQMNTLRKKGYSPVLLPKWGDYFMVSLGSYDTHEQATSAVKQLRSNLDQELWVMKR
jgi:cell division protein FtsN